MNIFITGASGFIGKNLTKELINNGHELYCVTRSDKSKINQLKNINWLEGNIDDDWSRELSQCEMLIHMAATGIRENKNDWEKCFNVNVIQPLNLFLKAAKLNVKKIICFGSGFEYGQAADKYDYIPEESSLEPKSAYAASKAAFTNAAWGLGVEYNLEMMILRPFYIYGPGENELRFWPQLIKSGKEGKNFLMTKGEQINDFLYISNAVKCITKLIFEREIKKGFPEIINLGSGEVDSLKNFAKKEWQKINANGNIEFGSINYRKTENMRYVPSLEKLNQIDK